MTLKNSSFFERQRVLFRRRLWPAALTFLCFLLYHVVGIATLVLVSMQNAAMQHLPAAKAASEITLNLRDMLGRDSLSAMLLVLPLAAVLAVEGFAWKDNRQEVDFYESQPVRRRQRFFDICISSFLYFVFSYAITLEIGLLIAVGAGALTRTLLLEILWQALRSLAFFLAIYSLGVLSTMLTGNVILAWPAFVILMIFEPLVKAVLRGYCSAFFATWSGQAPDLLLVNLFDPFYHYRYGQGAEGPMRLLALAVLYFLLAWICYRLRRNECAGTAVVFRPVRAIVRIALSVLTGLIVGLFFSSLQRNAPLAALWMVLFTVIAACIMQIIYDYDFRSLFRHPLEIAAAVALTLLIYGLFLFDAFGYDRFLPDPNQVSDAALICTDTYDSLYDEEGRSVDAVGFGEKYMHLQNVEDVITLAGYGQEYTRRKNALGGLNSTIEMKLPTESPVPTSTEIRPYEQESCNLTVLYRMKNGRTIYRSFQLPASVHPMLLDAVVGTPEFREGTFNICHDDVLRLLADDFIMDYTNGLSYSTLPMDPGKYEAFRSAYLRDLEQFDYPFARANYPVGRVTLNYDAYHAVNNSFTTGSYPDDPDVTAAPPAEDSSATSPEDSQGRPADGSSATSAKDSQRLPAELDPAASLDGMSMVCPVYATFDNTIAYLQENGLWLESVDRTRLAALSRQRDQGAALSKEDQVLLDSYDFWSLRGLFSPYEY